MLITKKILLKIINLYNCYIKKKKISNLINYTNYNDIKITKIWKIYSISNTDARLRETDCYQIFCFNLLLSKICWSKDYMSGFKYPMYRFDKIKISKWFNKGIDIKFPWQISCFYFSANLAQNYIVTGDKKYYLKFRDLLIDWIDNNPFCYGVNWYCTMEVAIRVINWIFAINLFFDEFNKDNNFKKIVIKSLIQHAEYISTFPEIYKNGHTTNHTTANYVGLLFLSLTLKEYSKSKLWLKQAIKGLEECIRYQTYEDGVNFEASIPYHRLVLEMFAYSAIIAKANSIKLSKKFYKLLFKMFEYTAAYMDHSGNSPQVGDNDSGRILIFHESDEHDHSYLLDLGEIIFNYNFKSQCRKRNKNFYIWLPRVEKEKINKLNIIPRDTSKTLSFDNGGAFFLKNENFSLMISLFPVGQNGVGGHNHLDIGSFTLSVKGKTLVTDPGTYTYTRSKKERDKFRSNNLHNLVLIDNIELEKNPIWGLKQYFKVNILEKKDNILYFEVLYENGKLCYFRRKIILSEKKIKINDTSCNIIQSLIHFSPETKIRKLNESKIILNANIIMAIKDSEIIIEEYYYSNSYDTKKLAKRLKIVNEIKNEYEIILNI